jgi:Predicted membrane protein (DUF2207)
VSRLRLLAPLAALALVLGPGAGVAAAAEGEAVASFDARIDVDARGDLHVTETIEYVFAGTAHHGLERDVRTRSGQPVLQVSASSPSGAPARVTVIAEPAQTTIRVGDPQRTVSGRQTYVLRYTVGGGVASRDELRWNATGNGWDVPIERASVRVTAPRPAVAARCYAGPEGSTRPCTGTAGATAVFAAQGLGPREGLTAVVAYPVGTEQAGRAPEPGALGQIVGFVLVMGLVTGLAILGQWFVKAAEAGPARTPAVPRDVPDTARSLVAVDLAGLPRPPAGLRPGHVAVLHAGRVPTTAVTATLADLTVRGHLRIDDASGRPSSWRLTAEEPPAGEALLPYEQTLLAALFTGRDSVTADELRGSRHLAAVRRQLLDDATDRGWFPRDRRPLDARMVGRGLAAGGVAVALVAHLGGTIVGFLAGLAVVAVGAVIGSRGDHPARLTPLGEAARLRVDRFREELTVARCPLEEADDVFSTLLPFAIALGLADDWTDRFRADVRGPRWSGAGSLDLAAAVSVFEATVESASASDTGPAVHSSGSSWWGHSSGSSFGSSSGSSSGFDSSGSSGSSDHGGGGGGGSSW